VAAAYQNASSAALAAIEKHQLSIMAASQAMPIMAANISLSAAK